MCESVETGGIRLQPCARAKRGIVLRIQGASRLRKAEPYATGLALGVVEALMPSCPALSQIGQAISETAHQGRCSRVWIAGRHADQTVSATGLFCRQRQRYISGGPVSGPLGPIGEVDGFHGDDGSRDVEFQFARPLR